ncbi:iron chaperone [Flindersiella endophytica]
MAATKKNAAGGKSYDGFTEEERAAMKERAKELKTKAKRSGKANGEAELLEKIAEMPDEDRVIAERIHAIVQENAPDLTPTTWYGQPAYSLDGKVVCFFQSSAKFKTRYCTLGFNERANLDEGTMWATAFALTDLSPADEARVAELVRKAAS